MSDLIVRGGTVVDGTGGPGRPGDVRVRDGVIVEVAPDLAPDGEHEVDARGALVTPGLIDSHTHYDLEMFWDPTLDPLPVYGMTTIVMGNCGLGIAPVRAEVRDDIADLLCFIEELPPALVRHVRAVGLESWSRVPTRRVADRPPRCTPFAYTAHNALRASRWAATRGSAPPPPTRASAWSALLDDALAHGSLGMSTNWFDTDRNGELVPSRLSDDAELDALLDVIARHPGATLQVIARERHDRRDALGSARAVAASACCRSATAWAAARSKTGLTPGTSAAATSRSARCSASRPRSRPPRSRRGTRWSTGPPTTKLATARRPGVAGPGPRHDWDDPLAEQNAFRREHARRADPLRLRERHRPGRHLARRARRPNAAQHPSDALADWVLANGIGSRYSSRTARGADDRRRPARAGRCTTPTTRYALMGGTDAGAHLTMFCGAGSNLYVLTHWARDEGAITFEQAVHCMTQRSADFFGLHDRGVVETGRRGDLAVFALDELETRDLERRYDLPEGRYRFTRPPAGFRCGGGRGRAHRRRRRLHRRGCPARLGSSRRALDVELSGYSGRRRARRTE